MSTYIYVYIHAVINVYAERHIHTYMYMYVVYTYKHAHTHTYTCFRNKAFTLVPSNLTHPIRFFIDFSDSTFAFPFFQYENPGYQQYQLIYSCAKQYNTFKIVPELLQNHYNKFSEKSSRFICNSFTSMLTFPHTQPSSGLKEF